MKNTCPIVLAALLFACTGGEAVDVPADLLDDSVPEVQIGDVSWPDAELPDLRTTDGVASEVAPEIEEDVLFNDSLPGCDVDPGAMGCACEKDSDCNSGYCVQFLAGKQCTMTCLEECPSGFTCALVSESCPDCIFLCVPDLVHLCKPCIAHDNCGDPKVESPDLCVDYGKEGRFCGSSCLGKDCPAGYECKSVEVGGGLISPQCIPTEGLCECSDLAISEGAETLCYEENEHGMCEGSRFCEVNGLTGCDAPSAEAEICDGEDNDCNGLADDGIVPAPCFKENDFGSCEGIEICAGGVPVCNADTPAIEFCDGEDNDCDGEIDEDSPDTDGDGFANCVDEDDDGDGVLDEIDICPLVPDPEQEDADYDLIGDLCDPDDDNDLYPDVDDCQPMDPDSHPGADEVCDGKDNDCDLWVDEDICDDENPCTDDVCDPIAGCTYSNNEEPCEDGDPCTSGDACLDGECVGGLDICPCATDQDCADLGYVGGCVGQLYCDLTGIPHVCKVDPTGAIPCPADPNPCKIAACDVNTGECVSDDAADQTPCEDGNPCTLQDACMGGLCLGGQAKNCNDGNPCTDDACDPATGCTHEFNQAPCDDGNACTTGDTCTGGGCAGGPAPSCDDGNPCTDDACDTATGCTHTFNQIPCDDGNACTTGDTCEGGWCKASGALNCDDGNPCSDDDCDTAIGCIHSDNQIPCDDGNACTTSDTCAEGVCAGGLAPSCDDDNPCTDDACDTATGCTHTFNQIPCDDGNACTTGDTCEGGWCKASGALNCDDGNPCTDDDCDIATGCTHDNNSDPCNDNNLCTITDACVAGGCVGAGTPDCDDGDPCTDNGCDPVSGCWSLPNEDPCDDDNACSTDDTCIEGVCVGGPALVCDDGNPCTDDDCNLAIGCTFDNNSDPCDDNSLCTIIDTCVGGDCVGADPLDCDDGNPCTDNGCEPDSGCWSLPNDDPCDDGNPCTTDDFCQDGECQAGFEACDDGDPCTADTCDDNGICIHEADLAAEACSEWVYEPESPMSCFLTSAPALTDNGQLWALGRLSCAPGASAYQATRLNGIDSVTGEQVGQFMVDSPASQPLYRQGRITLAFDWNSSYLHGAIGSYGLTGGAIAWQHHIGEHPRGGISMDENGTMYVNKHGTRAIAWSGSTLWSGKGTSYYIGGGTWIMGDGYIIGCEKYGDCSRISTGGSVSWTLNLGCRPSGTDSQARILFACGDQGVKVYKSDKSHAWTYAPDAVKINSLLVDQDDRIVAGNDFGQVVVLDPTDGSVISTIDVCPHGDESTFRPWMLTDNGWVYGICTSCDADNVCYDYRAVGVDLADPTDLWNLSSADPVRWISLTSDGHLVVLTGDKIYRLTIGDLALLDSPWPTVDHDLARTRNGKLVQ